MFQTIFLQTGGGSSMIGMLFPFLILAVFYFFIIRPQMNKAKEQQKFVESLKEGMEVFTQAGIIGKITKIEGNAVKLMVDEKTFMKVLKTSIVGEFQG